jgi:hypothetical protein
MGMILKDVRAFHGHHGVRPMAILSLKASCRPYQGITRFRQCVQHPPGPPALGHTQYYQSVIDTIPPIK